MSGKAFITGASGFIGRALGEQLRRDGWEVGGVDFAADPACGVVAGDVAEPGPWQAEAQGADVVLHTAAIVSNFATLAEQHRVNVVGTRQALDAAARAGAGRFVLFSSVRAFGDLGWPDGVEETWPVQPQGNPYVDTKIAAEQVALMAHAAGDVAVTVVRPGDVYGPGSKPWTVLPIEAIKAGQFALPANGKGIFSPIYIDDLVAGVLTAASVDASAGQVVTISGGVGVPNDEFFGHYARWLGKEIKTVPTPLAVGFATMAERVGRVTRRPTETTPDTIRYFTRTGTYSIEKARRLLGWQPEVDIEEGMRRTEAWVRAQGLI